MTQTNIIVNLQVEGIHNWPDAKEKAPEVAFLSYPHRHIFYITCKRKVSHSDRDIEIIMFKSQILKYLNVTYCSVLNLTICEFGSKSCEMLAEELLENFNLEYCSVLEDNENGAECFKRSTEITNIAFNQGDINL